MKNGEKKVSLVKKVGAIFNKLDNKICDVRKRIMTNTLEFGW